MNVPTSIPLDELKDLGPRGVEWRGMVGRLWFHQAPFMYRKSMELPENAKVLEIGTDEGFSAVLFGLPAHIGKTREVHCVDPHTMTSGAREKWDANIASNKLEETVTIHRTTSDQFYADNYLHDHFDLVFVDGDHSFPFVARDAVNTFLRLKPGGLFMIHDVEEVFPGPKAAWKMMAPLLRDKESCGSLHCGRKIAVV